MRPRNRPEASAERLADALARMRGAALKLGQMLSIQDENVLPPQVRRAPCSARTQLRHRPSLVPVVGGLMSSACGWPAALGGSGLCKL